MGSRIEATVQASFFWYRLLYLEPLFDLDLLDDVAAKAAYGAFREWNVSPENVTFRENAANLGEEATNISLIGGRMTFSITPGGCGLMVTNPTWSEADLIVKIGSAGAKGVVTALETNVDRQVATIGIHLTPRVATLANITSRFVNFDMSQVGDPPAQSFGFSVYRDDLLWVVDRSVSFRDSLFLRMDRWFRAEDSLERIANQLRDDELRLLRLLELEVK